ncbi:MAG TPA: type II toxin-antitoxin system RelE/ParE family toxin [Candidatus Limnocylindria bacterium]|nr:type II toxin-antitoxin system RelE/ParE family toxin [Candidatus Limnocylindria bacterium]
MARVEPAQPFRDDARRQLALLIEGGEWTRVDRLAEDLATLRDRLTRFPELGRELIGDDRHTLRRIALGRVPYFAWYRFDRRTDVVRLVRLFHARQRVPKPRRS